MHISLRSPLIAATAAVVGTGAIVMTPVTEARLNMASIPLPSVAQVALAGFHSPLAQLLGTVDLANQYILNGTSDVTDPASWPGANFGTEFGGPPVNLPGIVPGILGPYDPTNPPYGAFGTNVFTYVGVIPQSIVDGLPMISQLGINGSNYLNVTGNALAAAGIALSQGVWDAVGQAITLNIPAALATLAAAVNVAGTSLLAAGTYVASGVITNATAVFNVLAGSLPTLIGATLAQAQLVAASTVAVASSTVAALSAGNVQGAWNAAVDGLLGPTGVPGTLLNLTIGEGVQIAPITGATPAAIQASFAAGFVPSILTELQSATRQVVAALQTPNPVPPAAAASTTAHAAAASRAAAAAFGSSATAAGSSKKTPGHHRAVRAAATSSATEG